MPKNRARPRSTAGGVRSVRDGERRVSEAAGAGRSASPQTDPLITQKTGPPSGTPAGHPTVIDPREDAPVRRSLELENKAAATLADIGYRIKQNPTSSEVAQARQDSGDTGNAQSAPDYLLEGRVFDCYSPNKPEKPVRSIWSEVEDKVVTKQQTQRVVINLEDWRGDIGALQKQFDDWPIDGLKEVKILTRSNEVIQMVPHPGAIRDGERGD